MKIVALIVCDDHLYSGGYKTINSLKHFNPNIEVALYNTKEIQRVKQKHRIPDNLWFSAPFFCYDYIEKNDKPDILIKLGADCIVLDNIEEILNLNYDAASARNDPDQVGDRYEKHNRPDIIRDIPNHEWVNADFVCIKNFAFLRDWLLLTDDYKEGRRVALNKYGKIYAGDDMSSLNVVFRNYGYNTLILDPKGSDKIYGSSGNWSYSISNWDNWKEIYFNGQKSIMPDGGRGTGDRQIKILHQGGGTWNQKLNFNLFNEEFRKHIRLVTKHEN
jgi:hypothetical protein